MNSWGGVLRYLGYAAFVVAVGFLVLAAGLNLPGGLQLSVVVEPAGEITTSEFSIVEHLQNLMIIFCGLIFGWIA